MAFKGDISTYIRQIVTTASQDIAKTYRDYERQIDEIKNPLKYADFFEKLSIVGGAAYSFLDGAWKSYTGFYSGAITAFINAFEKINDIDQLKLDRLAGQGDVLGVMGSEITQKINNLDEAGALFVNDLKTIGGITAVSIGSMTQNLTQQGLSVLGVETNWTNQWAKDAVKSLMQIQAKTAYEIRTADPSKNIFENPNISPQQNVSGANVPFTAEQFERSAEWYKDAEENYEKYKQFLDQDYNPDYKKAIDLVDSIKGFADKLTDNKFVKDITFKTKADELYGQYDWYQQINGVISSMAAVLTAKYTSKFIKDPNIAAIYANGYFGIQIFGNAFSEARQNGATIQDAYTYAYANAALETLIENIGGATPSGKIKVIPSDFNEWFRFAKTVLKSAAAEGVEEIVSEFATPGFDIFKEPVAKQAEFGFERFATETAIKRVMTAFLAGAISGGFFGAAQFLQNRNTLNEKINLFQDAQQLKVETPEQRVKAAKILQKTSDSILAALNNPNTKGYIKTKDGRYKIGKLTSAQKLGYYYSTGVDNILEIDWVQTLGVSTAEEAKAATTAQMQQSVDQNQIVFAYKDGVAFNENLFKSYYGVDATGQRIAVDSEFWGVNKATLGVELTNPEVGEGKPLRLVAKNALNEKGKLILENAKNKKVPVVVVSMTPEGVEKYKGTQAFYSNGVIYVNQDATGLTEDVIKKEIVKHEFIHLIASKFPEIYMKLENIFDEVFSVEVNLGVKVGNKVKVTTKSEQYSGLLKLVSELGYIEKINASANDLFAQEEANLRKRLETLTPEQYAQQEGKIKEIIQEKIFAKLREEAIAYFAEIIIKETPEFLKAIEGKDADLSQSIKDVFEKKLVVGKKGIVTSPFGELNRVERYVVESFAKEVTTAARQFTEERSLAKFFVEEAFGTKEIKTSQYMIPSMLEKYGEGPIFRALIKLNIQNQELEKEGKPKDDTLVIEYKDKDGNTQKDTVKIQDIFFYKDAAEIFKKVDANVTKTTLQTFVDKFSYDPKRGDYYVLALAAYEEILKQTIATLKNSINPNDVEQTQKTNNSIKLYENRIKIARLLALDFQRHVSGESVVTISDFAKDSQWDPTNPRLNIDYVREIMGKDTRPKPTERYRIITVSAAQKRTILAWAIYEAEVANRIQPKKGISVKEAKLNNIELNAISAILKSLKDFLQVHSPVVDLRTKDWVNSAYLSTASKIGGLNLELDFLIKLENEHGAINRASESKERTNDKIDKYTKSMEILVENYRAVMTTLLSTTHEYQTSNGTRKRTFSLEDYDFEVAYQSDENNVPSILTISIVPTQKLLNEQVEKIKAIEQARTEEAEKSRDKNLYEMLNNMSARARSVFFQKQEELETKVIQAKDHLVTLVKNNSIPLDLGQVRIIDYPVAVNIFTNKIIDSFNADGITVEEQNKPYDYKTIDGNNKPLSLGQISRFKNSVVRDEVGRLRVVYHGTPANFENFSVYTAGAVGNKFGVGFYFATDRDISIPFAQSGAKVEKGETTVEGESSAAKQTRDDLKQGIKIRSFYLDIEKPLSGEQYSYRGADIFDVDENGRASVKTKYQNLLFTRQQVEDIIYEVISQIFDLNVFIEGIIKTKDGLPFGLMPFYLLDGSRKQVFLKLLESVDKTDAREVAQVISKMMFILEYDQNESLYHLAARNGEQDVITTRQLIKDSLNTDFNTSEDMELTLEDLTNFEQKNKTSLGADVIVPQKFIEYLNNLADIVLQQTDETYREFVEDPSFDSTEQLARQSAFLYPIINTISDFDGFFAVSVEKMAQVIEQNGKLHSKMSLDLDKTDSIILVAWFQNQMKSVTNYNPDSSINVYGQTQDEVQFVKPTALNVTRSDNNVAFITPYTQVESAVKSIEEAIKVAPLVVANLPATWVNFYKNHKALPDNVKVVSIKRQPGTMLLQTKTGEKARATNIATVVLADKLSMKYLELTDLRLTENQDTVSDFTTNSIYSLTNLINFLVSEANKLITINKLFPGDEQAKKSLNHDNMRIVINEQTAAPITPTEKIGYSSRFSDYLKEFIRINESKPQNVSGEQLVPVASPLQILNYTLPIDSNAAIIVTFSNPGVARFFDSVDFENLFKKGSVAYGQGFNVSDLVQNYKANKQAIENQEQPQVFENDVAPRKTAVSPLTQENITLMNKLFGNAVASTLFVVDAKGNLKTKFSRFLNKRPKLNRIVTLGGKTYDGRTYAININYDPDFSDRANLVEDENYLKLSDLSPEQKLYFDALVSAGFNFGFYSDTRSSALGFSYTGQKTNFFYINVGLIGTKVPRVIEIAIHEQFHEIFKAIANVADSLGKTLADIMFEYDPVDKKYYPTSLTWEFFNSTDMAVPDPTFDKKNVASLNYFINGYLLSAGSYTYMKGIIASAEDIQDVLFTPTADLQARKRGDEWVRTKNEVMAQIVGKLFADRRVFEIFLKGKPDASVVFLDALTKLIKNSVHEQGKKALLEVAAQQYADINNQLAEEFNKKYPFKPLFTNKDINEFIRVYTDGLYGSKAALVNAYLNERQNKKSGRATAAFNSVLLMASQYEKLVQNGTETYKKFTDYLTNLLKNATFAFKGSASEVLFSLKPTLFKALENMNKKMKELAKGISDGSITMTPSNPGAMNPVTLQLEPSVFDLETFVVAAKNIVQEFLNEYGDIPVELVQLFSLPSVSDLQKELDLSYNSIFPIILNNLKSNPDTISKLMGLMIFSAVQRFENNFAPIVENYKLALDYIGGKAQKINSSAALGGSIIGLRQELFTKETQETATLMRGRLDANLDKITQGSIQGKAPLSNEMNKIIARVQEVIKLFKDFEFTSIEEFKLKVKGILDAIVADGMDILNSKFDVAAMTAEEIDVQKDFIEGLSFTFNKHIIAAYTQLGLLTGDLENMIKAIPTSVATTFETNQLIQHYQKLKKPPEYSAKTMASALGNLVSLYQQRYTTSLSEKDQTHDELAIEINEEFTNFKKKGLPVRDARLDKINFQTPQDYFLKYREFFKDKGVKIFDLLWKQYVKSAVKAEDILRDFDVAYLDFKKKNKGIQQRSLEQAIDPDTEDGGLDVEVLLQIDPDVLQTLRDEVKEEQKAQKEEIDKISAEIKQTVAEKKVLNDQIKVLKEERKQYTRGSFKYQQITAQIRALESSKAPFLQKEKDLRAEKKAFVVIDGDEALKIKVSEYLYKNPNLKPNQKITRGQLITLYMSVSRELEMAEIAESNAQNGVVNVINPTNHFGFGNFVNMFDSEILRKKGLNAAKKASRLSSFVILVDKQALKEYLENLLTEEDRVMMDFAQQNFKKNYVSLNEGFKARFGVDLPYQSIYIPFSTVDSNYERELNLQLIRRRNIGVASGMVTETTLGASQPLKIENIFSVIENHVKATSNYSFDRLIKDWQNLLVNKAGKLSTPLQAKLPGVAGLENNFIEFFNRMFADVLNYSDITEDGWLKFYRKRLSRIRAATLAFGVKSPLKQLGSLYNISVKNKTAFLSLMTNLVKTMPKNKYYKWLMENSSNFYFRAKISNIPDLAKEINSSPALKAGNVIDGVLKLGLKGMGYLDAVVIVAAFKTFADEIRENYNVAGMNQVTEEQILEEAYEKLFNEVLLFGVANSNPAFRSHFSNDKNLIIQLISKFQSENVLHWSAIVRQLDLSINKVQGAPKELLREILALLLSGFWSSIVNVGISTYVLDRIAEEDVNFEFWVNDFVWNNIVGSLPYVNTLTQMISFNPEAPLLIDKGYEFTIPFYTELFNIVEILSTGLINQDTQEFNFRKALRIMENILVPFGISAPNIRTIVEIVFGTAAGFGNTKAIDVVQWFAGQSDSQAFSEAIKEGNRTFINKYIEDTYTDARVVRHIRDLVASDPTIKLSLKNENYFITVDENGVRKTHDIKSGIKSIYRRLTLKALRSLISNKDYRRLSAKKKAETLQRVINYYWNYMKDDILNKKDKTKSNVDDESAVVERAIWYAYN